MNVIKHKTIKQFCRDYPDVEEALETWFSTVGKANWANFNELKKAYPSADQVGDNRVVFNIRGNNYRLIVRISFLYQNVMIKWFGTHADYDRINVLKV